MVGILKIYSEESEEIRVEVCDNGNSDRRELYIGVEDTSEGAPYPRSGNNHISVALTEYEAKLLHKHIGGWLETH